MIFEVSPQPLKQHNIIKRAHIIALGAAAILFLAQFGQTVLARDIQWESLNLTSQQANQMEQLEDNWAKVHQEVGSQIDRDTDELKAILPTGDTQRIRVLQNRIMNNKMYLMNQSMDTFLKKRDMLTPNQRAQLQKMMPTRHTTAEDDN